MEFKKRLKSGLISECESLAAHVTASAERFHFPLSSNYFSTPSQKHTCTLWHDPRILFSSEMVLMRSCYEGEKLNCWNHEHKGHKLWNVSPTIYQQKTPLSYFISSAEHATCKQISLHLNTEALPSRAAVNIQAEKVIDSYRDRMTRTSGGRQRASGNEKPEVAWHSNQFGRPDRIIGVRVQVKSLSSAGYAGWGTVAVTRENKDRDEDECWQCSHVCV